MSAACGTYLSEEMSRELFGQGRHQDKHKAGSSGCQGAALKTLTDHVCLRCLSHHLTSSAGSRARCLPARSSPTLPSATSGLLDLFRDYGTLWGARRPEEPSSPAATQLAGNLHSHYPVRRGDTGATAGTPASRPPPQPWGRASPKPTASTANPRACLPAPCRTNQSKSCCPRPASFLLVQSSGAALASAVPRLRGGGRRGSVT